MRLALLLSLLAGIPPDGDDASHFPLIPGSRWEYKTQLLRWSTRVGEPGPGREGPPRTVLCAEDKEGTTLRSEDGAVRLTVTREGVYQGSVHASNLILKFPLKKFDDWEGGDKKNGISRFTNHGQVDLEVGGTKYRCWKIREQRSVPKGLRTWTRWYAPGVGLVWEDYSEEIAGTVTQRICMLESYEKEAGKK
ncbi:MAG TPA: hypothetical protein VNM14_17795 [Planctomycetota bacterium]|jgi:hypothetical protein|nr:hypothetical protein [Planctomycetota bacterium]